MLFKKSHDMEISNGNFVRKNLQKINIDIENIHELNSEGNLMHKERRPSNVDQMKTAIAQMFSCV